jgi:glycerophosphoryl diester phosphodiesterase
MITAQPAIQHMQQPVQRPEGIAHRGVRDRYPENSLPAFQAALDEGVDAVELDVHATRDGILVVHHDAMLPASSKSLLAGRAIGALESSDLEAFELAPGVGVPTLEEVLQSVAPVARIYIEIKASNIEALLAELLRRLPEPARKCAVHSFDHRIVRNFGALAPAVPTGILQVGYPVDPASVLSAAHARDLWQACEFIDDELVGGIHSSRGRVIAWTCNDQADWKRLRDLGVDGICTDRSAAFMSWLREA